MQGDEQRTFAMKALGDNNEVVGIEHFACAHNGIQRAEARIIQHDICRIDAAFN